MSRVLALVAIILVGAAAAGGWTVLSLSAGGSASASSTSSTSLAGSAPGVSTTSGPAGLASSSTTSTPCLLNSTGAPDLSQLNSTLGAMVGNLTSAMNEGAGNVTVADLFGNFTQMTLTSGVTGTTGVATSSSYQVAARPMVGSLKYYEVDFNTTADGFNDSSVVMFAPNGTATSVTSDFLGNYTGAPAQAMGEADVSSFLIQLHSSAYAKSIESDPGLAVINSTTVSLGPTQVKMTYYDLKAALPAYCGVTVNQLVEGLGTVEKTGLTMVMYSETQVTEQGAAVGVTNGVESLTLAGP